MEKNCGYAEALLGYLLQVRDIIASAFVGFVLANLLIAHRASLDNWLGCRGFLRQPDKSTSSRGLGGYEGKLLRYQFFAESVVSDTTATNPPHPFRLRSLARSARLDCSNTRSISACSTRLRSIVLQLRSKALLS